MAKIVCHAQKQETLTSMPHHIERIGVYDADGKVVTIPDPKNPEKQISKYPQIRYPENRIWNRGGEPLLVILKKNGIKKLKCWNGNHKTTPLLQFVSTVRQGKNFGRNWGKNTPMMKTILPSVRIFLRISGIC